MTLQIWLLIATCFAGGFIIIHYGWNALASVIKATRREDSDAYYRKVLGVGLEYDAETLRQSYLALTAKYDPVRFQEFGPEFQDLAKERLKVIEAAYDCLSRRCC